MTVYKQVLIIYMIHAVSSRRVLRGVKPLAVAMFGVHGYKTSPTITEKPSEDIDKGK